jgi:hypothetical protein
MRLEEVRILWDLVGHQVGKWGAGLIGILTYRAFPHLESGPLPRVLEKDSQHGLPACQTDQSFVSCFN